MPKISVIVPVYKVEPYIRDCVDSILKQTFTDFELILIDDGSPDNCPLICEEYAKKDKRIIVVHKPNGGLSSARNNGLDYVFKNSDSTFITFIDSDDVVHKNYLKIMVQSMGNSDMVVSNYRTFTNNISIGNSISIKSGTYCREKYWKLNYSNNRTPYITAWGKLYKKEIFQNLRFPNGKLHEDEFLIHHIVFLCSTITVINDELYFYRERPQSIMNDSKLLEERKIARIEFLIDRAKFLLSQKIDCTYEYKFAFGLISEVYFRRKRYLKPYYFELKYIYKKIKSTSNISLNERVFFVFPYVYSAFKNARKE